MSASQPTEFRHMRSSSLTVPSPNGSQSPMPGSTRFDGPRSPPNTSHVPCKFFRQGACQAGNACPFNHDLGTASETICKYFAKGNCKFGPKCANIHVLPDGRRINYSKNGVTIGPAPISLGSRVSPTTYHHPSNSALTNSFMRGGEAVLPSYTATSPYSDDRYHHHLGRQPSLENGLPTIDTTYTSNPTSAYGSPRDDDLTRFGLGLSPVTAKGLSVLDAPLPASFDSNGISHAARYGPWPASVPSKFGLESPSPSLGAAKDGRTSEALKLLHNSAFGIADSPSALPLPSTDGSGGAGAIGSSSPVTQHLDEYFGKRAMHSSSLRYAKPRLLSSSAPKVDRDWEPEFLFEEDYVPGALANEVLTPAEKARRGSMRLIDGSEADSPSPAATGSVPGHMAGVTKFGSPVGAGAASPSRWGPLFQRQRAEEEAAGEGGNGAAMGMGMGSGKSMKHAVSAFGHVGSPLRQSSLAGGLDLTGGGAPSSNGSSSTGRPGGTPSRSGSGSESLSVLTQQLQRTRLGEDSSAGSSPHLHPNAARNSTGSGLGPIGGSGKERDGRDRGLERHVSSGSIESSLTGRFTTPIDEEDPAFVFSMEEEDEAQQLMRSRKRISGAPFAGGSALGGGWSYAGVAAGKTASAAATATATPGAHGSGSKPIIDGVGGR